MGQDNTITHNPPTLKPERKGGGHVESAGGSGSASHVFFGEPRVLVVGLGLGSGGRVPQLHLETVIILWNE